MEETIPAMDFIERLIRHIPERHFKMIRYGGLYAHHHGSFSKHMLLFTLPKDAISYKGTNPKTGEGTEAKCQGNLQPEQKVQGAFENTCCLLM